MVRGMWESTVEGDQVFSDVEPLPGTCFLTNRLLRAHLAAKSHGLYWAIGGKYKSCRPKDMKPGKLKLPPPQSGPLVRIGWDSVLAVWRDKLDREGKLIPIDDARRIRGVTPPRAEPTVRRVSVM
jgi:hypothetical protein